MFPRCLLGKHTSPADIIFCKAGNFQTKADLNCRCKVQVRDLTGVHAVSNFNTSQCVEKLGAVIVKLHRKRAEYKSQMEKQSVPQAIFSLVDVKNTFFLSPWESEQINMACNYKLRRIFLTLKFKRRICYQFLLDPTKVHRAYFPSCQAIFILPLQTKLYMRVVVFIYICISMVKNTTH